jgi:hypothetical protein
MFDVYEVGTIEKRTQTQCGVVHGREKCTRLAEKETRGSCVHEHSSPNWIPVCGFHLPYLDSMVCAPCGNHSTRRHVCAITYETRAL